MPETGPKEIPESERKKAQKEASQEEPSKELRRKLSKTTLHAAERGKRSLFEKMTAENAEKIAAAMKERPIFYEEKGGAPTRILLDKEIAPRMPDEFFEDPTKWIESQPVIERSGEVLPTGETVEELWKKPYDVSKVREFEIELPDGTKQTIVSKRIDPKETEEVALARKAYEAGIPTPKVLGEITHKGNIYALFEHIDGINLKALERKMISEHRTSNQAAWDTIVSTPTEEEYEAWFPRKAKKYLKESEARKLHQIWERAQAANIRGRILSILRDHLPVIAIEGAELDTADTETKRKKLAMLEATALETQNLMEKYSADEFIKILRALDNSADDLPELFNPILFHNDQDLAKRYKTKVQAFLEATRRELEQPLEDFARELRVAVAGFDYQEEAFNLRNLIEAAGLEHKDYAERNLLIPWDFENDRPRATRGNEPRLYVIDWEKPSKSRSPSKKTTQ